MLVAVVGKVLGRMIELHRFREAACTDGCLIGSPLVGRSEFAGDTTAAFLQRTLRGYAAVDSSCGGNRTTIC